MAEVLFSNTYFLALDPKQEANKTPYPPLATIFAAALLRQNGHSVELADTHFLSGPSDVFPAIDRFAGKVFIICDDGFNYLTKMCLVNMRNACLQMINYAKQKGCMVLVASSDTTDNKNQYLEAGADFIIVGEVEQTLLELVNKIEAESSDFSNVDGLVYLTNQATFSTSPRKVIQQLDELPQPAWDLIDIEKYRSLWQSNHGQFSLNVATTRGCPFKCNWCAKPIYGNRYNAHSPEYIVSQIELLVNEFRAKHIWFCDDIFGLKPGWIHRFRELVEEKDLKFKYKIQCRADLLLDENNIADLAHSGCDEVWIGAESGSQNILDAMDKGTTIEQIVSGTKLMKSHGIKPCFFLQFGYPGESMDEIKLTIQLMEECMPYDIGISVSYPLPGTKFYEQVKGQMDAKTNWDDSDELAMMFTGTYPPQFYKLLHRYVHRRFRKAQGEALVKGSFANIQNGVKRLALWPYYTLTMIYYKYNMNKLLAH